MSQITASTPTTCSRRREEFLKLMEKLRDKQEFDMVMLMITDVLQEGSHIFYVGSDDVIAQPSTRSRTTTISSSKAL